MKCRYTKYVSRRVKRGFLDEMRAIEGAMTGHMNGVGTGVREPTRRISLTYEGELQPGLRSVRNVNPDLTGFARFGS